MCLITLSAVADLVVRTHEIKDEGYEIDHDGKSITIFFAPNYCDQVISLSFLFELYISCSRQSNFKLTKFITSIVGIPLYVKWY